MKLIIVRHGETDWNSLELCQGHANPGYSILTVGPSGEHDYEVFNCANHLKK